MKKISLFVSLLFVSLFSLPVLSQEHFEHKPLGKILAHRGASYMAPENTLLAFKLAIQTGSHGAECDVHRTSDGVLVLFHDRTTKRTLGLDGDITGQTFEEIAKLDAGRWKGRHFAGEKVPTLEEYLLLMKGSGCTPAIELKQEGIEKDVVEVIRKTDTIDEAVVLAFRREALEIIRKLEPKIGLILNFSKKIEGPPEDHARKLYEEIMAAVGPAGIKTVSINYKILSRELIELLHKDEIEVSCWVANDIPLINKMLDMGVDTVCSDRPELVAEVLKFRAGIQ